MGVSKVKNKAVFFDRDGVINYPVIIDGKPYPPNSLNELVLIENVNELLYDLKKKDFHLFVVTNQPDVGRGSLDKESVEKIHKFMLRKLPLDQIYVCYDDGIKQNSEMRKPEPGMILQAKEEYNLNLNDSYMIGDRWKDIDSGVKAGCKTIFIDWGYKEDINFIPDKIVKDLKSGVDWILKKL